MDDKDETAKKEAAADLSSMLGFGGLFDGVSNLIQKFGELAEKGESLRQATQNGESPSGKKMTTSYGFSVKFGQGGQGKDSDLDIQPLTKSSRSDSKNSTSNSSSDSPSVSRIREPHVELFDEDDHLLVVAEMPGVSSQDIDLSFVETMLHIQGTSKTADFKTTIELPRLYGPDNVSITANNGVIEIRLRNVANAT